MIRSSTLERVQSRMAEANQRRMHPTAKSQTGNEEAMDVGPEAEMDKQAENSEVAINADEESQKENLIGSSEAEVGEDEEIEEEDEIAIPEYSLVPEGPCEFIIVSAKPLKNVETPYGLKIQVLITFTVKQTDEKYQIKEWSLNRRFNVSVNENSNLMKFHAQIRLPKPNKTLSLKGYIGIFGKAEIKHVILDNGDTIPIIENFTRWGIGKLEGQVNEND